MNNIYFTTHALERYGDRFDNIDSIENFNENEIKYEKIPSLEKEIRRSGRWYQQEESDIGFNNYLCVVNNLKVYRAVMKDNGDVVITTTYPYKKQIKGLINKKTERRKDIDEKLAAKLPLGKGNIR